MSAWRNHFTLFASSLFLFFFHFTLLDLLFALNGWLSQLLALSTSGSRACPRTAWHSVTHFTLLALSLFVISSPFVIYSPYLAAVKAVGAFGAPSGFVPTARWFRRPVRFFGAVCWMRLLDVCVPGSPEHIRSGSGSRASGCRVFFRLVQPRESNAKWCNVIRNFSAAAQGIIIA